MLNKIQSIYRNVIIQSAPIDDAKFYCFFDELSKMYFAIPKEDIRDQEKQLLETFFLRIEPSTNLFNRSTTEQKWFRFLTEGGQPPLREERRIRYIHFFIRGKANRDDFKEALTSFFQDHMTIVWLRENSGVIIEKETEEILLRDDVLSFTEAVLSDFYFSVDFYLGRFYRTTSALKDHFSREQQYFYLSKKILPQTHIFTFETAFPLTVMAMDSKELATILHAEWEDLFRNDREQLETIKLYLENNLNTSLTAKKLFLHRNSLQYRIDKFIERSSIDIKDFKGAISVYFICIFAETILSER
ncbi:PucR family transcriptional regulator [Fervidibacillus albus]|uniref:Helix-turn-helix domain-containing protein n=1 Tax=Fervidibacillus albus TaxID=2980026 RepID=A0A9E8RVB4_9BACI|nr:helix-turn-helix domain-containing protein [Fervidibacillus albus]WAA08733.1 helix-turn-helix domain-containing protein [Fervidibacillus albus]